MRQSMSGVSVALVVAAAVAVGPGAISAQEPVTVNVAVLGVMGEAPMYINMEKGAYQTAGMRIVTVTFAGGSEVMPALAANQVQVAVSAGITVGLFNAAARGLPVRIVAASSDLPPGADGNAFIIRPDLVDVLKTPADLKGRRIGLVTRTSPQAYQLGKALATVGLGLKDVEIVTIPFPDMGAAFERKAIDVALVAEPFTTMYTERKAAVLWKRPSEYIHAPPLQISAVFYNTEWAQKNPDIARAFIRLWIRGAREYDAARRGGPTRPDVVRTLVKYLRIKQPAMYDKMVWNHINPNGYVDRASLLDQQQWYVANGMLERLVPLEQIVDDTFVRDALRDVGASAS